MANKLGRPTTYSPELGEKICEVIVISPYGLDKICKENDDFPPARNVYRWLKKHPVFCHQYARAKIEQANIFAEEILNTVDKSNINDWQHARFKVDTLKWLLSKLLPKQYGDKYVIERKEEDENSEANKEMLKLSAEMDKKNRKDY